MKRERKEIMYMTPSFGWWPEILIFCVFGSFLTGVELYSHVHDSKILSCIIIFRR